MHCTCWISLLCSNQLHGTCVNSPNAIWHGAAFGWPTYKDPKCVFFSVYLLYYPVSVGAKLTAFYIAIDIRLCFLRSSFFFCLFLNWNSVRVLDPFVAVSERRGDSVTLSRHSGRFAGRRQVAAARVSTLPCTGSGEFRRLSLHSCRCSDLTCFFTTFPHFCFTSAKLGVVVVVVIDSVIKGRQSSIEK